MVGRVRKPVLDGRGDEPERFLGLLPGDRILAAFTGQVGSPFIA